MQTEARKTPTENNGLWTAWLARFQAGAAAVTLLAATPAFAQNAPPSVTVATPVTRDVAEWQEHTARIEPSARVEIRPRVSGQIDQVHFEDGAIVRQGDLLFTIDQRPFRIAVDQAQAGLARAEAQLTLAAQQVERYTPLAQSRIAPQAELDTRRSQLREAQAGVTAARAALSQAELDLEFTEVRAPRPGRVSDRRVDAGNLVQQGQTLLTTLLALDPVYVSFDASEADYLRQARAAAARGGLRAGGARVQLRLLDETDYAHEGRIDFVDSAFDARSGTIRARAVVPNADLFLTPGTFARLRLFEGDAPALLVPDTSVMADQSGRMVLTVAADGTVTPRSVQLGPLTEGLRVVRSGLTAQDRVIIGGLHRARPGMRVTAEQGRIGQGPIASR
ncbi:efflux RND transporter periplasmic adaptor subunit [Plastoroseomonas hellenica]|uniref:Efflux RND transporter periplasmic adaptor subunit n=1 Tax=Plastoroseomonas hellenica TaxID=2687306 RepID=A0ABS5ESJ9_9PROT|nr:efflux RND transporter periplasmic adaptor subunit [Plastoroseomonas hellenica]MBR0647439.1 efflux RND transporter periplasmic adaptor subunit [Plastoroseomonas hellenica]MBR0663269.1 efflux RND transporter periplasmic adaptor subunit [Plastoroseomonas hellenica]